MAKLITYAYLRTECDISQNIEDKNLDNPIKRAQDQLKFLIGKGFYAELLSENDSNSLTTDNSAFFDPYVKQFLAWQAYAYWLPKANNYTTKIGVRIFKEDNSDPATDKSMGELIRDAKEAVNQYQGLMLSFLKAEQSEDSSKYPNYTANYKSGSSGGFHITAISKKSTTRGNIDNEIFSNG
jgi:hypothetical protein